MRIIPMMLAGSALILLGACDKGASGANDGKPQSAEEVAQEIKKVSLQPGEWETTQEIVDVTMEGAPKDMHNSMFEAMKGRKTSDRRCITPEEAANPNADFLTAQKDSKCTYSGFEMSGGKVHGAISCPAPDGKGKADITLDGTYTPTSYQMNMEMQAAGMANKSAPDMKMHMKISASAKRIGECPAAAK